MSVTIKDVAKEANVSIATVSRVLNGQDKVKKETREKIFQAIKKLNYKPDQAARTMINKKTKTIGMIVPLLSNEYWAALAEIAQSILLKKGYTLIIGSSNIEQEGSQSVLNAFLERRVDGLIVGRLHTSIEKESLKFFDEKEIPIITFDSEIENYSSVSGDNLKSSMLVVEHLLNQGHEKIAFIGALSTPVSRELGFRNAMMMNHLKLDESIIISGRNENVYYFSQYGYQSAKKLVESQKEFTALFCSNDLIAIGAIKAIEELGKRVPQDVAVVGFDDISIASLYRPALTTIRQPIKQICEMGIDLLLEQIENLDKESLVRKIELPMELVIRESSKKS